MSRLQKNDAVERDAYSTEIKGESFTLRKDGEGRRGTERDGENGVHNEGTKLTETNEDSSSVGLLLESRICVLFDPKHQESNVLPWPATCSVHLMLIDPFSTNRLTSAIIGGAIRVHKATGPGLLESVYFPCLLFEVRQSGLAVVTQWPIPLVYRGIHLEAGYRADMLVEDTVLVELKSVESFSPIHTAQMLTYLKLSSKPVGLLINFNVPVLKDGVKRILNPGMAQVDPGDPIPSVP